MSILDSGFKNFMGRFFSGRTDKWTSPASISSNQLFTPGSATWEKIEGNEADIFQSTGLLQIIINKKASMKASGRWREMERQSDGTSKEIHNSPWVKLLNKPNIMQSKDEFLKQLEINRCVFGANFIYPLKAYEGADIPSALWNIMPSEMTIYSTGKIYQQTKMDEIIKKFVYNEGGTGSREYSPNDILYMKLENVENPILPVSPFYGMNMEISNSRAAMGYRNVILRKKGAIGILSNQSKDSEGGMPLKSSERKNIEDQYLKDNGIQDNQSKVILSEASLQWQPMTYPTKDLMLFEEIDSNMKKLIDRYGLNENLFSRDNQSTYDNMLEAQKMAYQDTIIPESKDDAESMTKFFNLSDKRYLDLDYSHLPCMKEDENTKSEVDKRKAETYKILIDSGVSVEEAEIRAGYKERD